MSPPATATAAAEAKTIVLRIRVSPCRSAAGTGRYVTRIWLKFGVGITKTAPELGAVLRRYKDISRSGECA